MPTFLVAEVSGNRTHITDTFERLLIAFHSTSAHGTLGDGVDVLH